MPQRCVAVMVCDWGARAIESHTSLQDFIDGKAMRQYGYTKADPVYERIMHYKQLLCDEPFTLVKTSKQRD
jgi:hypothetical protein